MLSQEVELRRELVDEFQSNQNINNKRWEERLNHQENSLTTIYKNKVNANHMKIHFFLFSIFSFVYVFR